MGFSEEIFLFAFMPLSIIIYLLIAQFKKSTINNFVLVIISLVFYAWSSLDTLVLFIILNIFVFLLGNLAYGIRNIHSDKQIGKISIIVAILMLLALLIYYKYVPFVIQTINSISAWNLSVKTLIVPIGLSFVTFEAISYVIDIYRGDALPGSFLETFVFLSFFPKLVSGPIILWKDFRTQLRLREPKLDQVVHGFYRIAIGLAKKAIIADTFGAKIQQINDGIALGGVDLQTMWLKAILYFFELYFDFSGYSDIAIGLSNIFGFSVKENFNFPYISKSVSEFWRRWHISLGSWFREYVYIPLGGNRSGNVYLNLFIVFLLTGIWHGANWTFLAWGIIHGIFVVIERFVRDKQWYIKTPEILKWLVTMIVIFFTWIIFMSSSLYGAYNMVMTMFHFSVQESVNFTWEYYLTKKIIILLVIATVGAFIGAFCSFEKVRELEKTRLGGLLQKLVMIILLIIDILFVVNSTYSPFIYFQF